MEKRDSNLNLSKLTPTKRRVVVGALPPKDRLDYVRKMYVKYPQTERILKRIAEIHEEGCDLPEDLEPENNILVTGIQGAGKTRVITRYKKLFESKTTNKVIKIGDSEVTYVPILSASLPHRATDKTVVTELLRQLGDPDPDDGSTEVQITRLFDLMDKCSVEIIILDEFQHIIDAENDKILMKVANFLKRILKRGRKPLVLVGMPHSTRILNNNPQFNRLFTKRMSIKPLLWNEDESKKCELKIFLEQIDDLLPLPERSNLSDQEIAYKISLATGGLIGKVMQLLRKAAEFAINESKDSISENELYRAFIDQLEDQDERVENPFLVHKPKRSANSIIKGNNSDGGTNRRVRATQEKLTANKFFSLK